ncbi:hypothetical protein ASPVEDRAFT_83208 [Aspergillus versicolor CBS 583.65]|uniref:Uncharacterized protein n=1 Tax=Aspergillus versicolor CBS 583.65 TaxID=1036611 RepID=A0A1L9PJI0_ASPVE|nr:uncharacterized protein ASPVEDRAFT_83208 [Aspergillus versicolor CBS 583.65]OJJ01678.1 hypothetical protein ASPVEDRAFT_83208 [Aspergillus versicolor CBS 583.65]
MRYAASYYDYSSLSQSPELPGTPSESEYPEYISESECEQFELDFLSYLQNKRQKECEAGICDCLSHDPPEPLKTGPSHELIKVTLTVSKQDYSDTDIAIPITIPIPLPNPVSVPVSVPVPILALIAAQ